MMRFGAHLPTLNTVQLLQLLPLLSSPTAHPPSPGSQATNMTVTSEVDDIVGKHSTNLRDELDNLIRSLTTVHDDRFRKLEKEVEERKTIAEYLAEKLHQAQNHIDNFKKDTAHSYDRRIVCLIDGDGSIFSLSHIARGNNGGLSVAAKLTEAIRQRFPAKSHEYQLHVWVFFNKSGLYKTLGNCGKEDARNNLEDFVHGFNQAAERFLMVDIGYGKEMADAKIKANLEDETRSPQTTNVVFGGCHDNGYLNTLRSLITGGHKDKLVLMPGYKDMAAGFAGLDLPVLTVPDLFEPIKLCAPSPVIPVPARPVNLNQTRGRSGSTSGSPPLKSPPAYAAIVQHQSALVPYRRGSTPPGRKARHLDPSKALSKQDPPPCNLFYLTDSCNRGETCRFAHDYLISTDHLEEMRENARKSPCVSTIQSGVCLYGEKCCFGHKCPQGSGCRFRLQGICKFTASGMHSAE